MPASLDRFEGELVANLELVSGNLTSPVVRSPFSVFIFRPVKRFDPFNGTYSRDHTVSISRVDHDSDLRMVCM